MTTMCWMGLGVGTTAWAWVGRGAQLASTASTAAPATTPDLPSRRPWMVVATARPSRRPTRVRAAPWCANVRHTWAGAYGESGLTSHRGEPATGRARTHHPHGSVPTDRGASGPAPLTLHGAGRGQLPREQLHGVMTLTHSLCGHSPRRLALFPSASA